MIQRLVLAGAVNNATKWLRTIFDAVARLKIFRIVGIFNEILRPRAVDGAG